MSEALDRIREILRYSRIGEWHNSKMPYLLTLLMLLGLCNPSEMQIRTVLVWYVLWVLFLSFGYMINNLSDAEIDRRAGKRVALPNWSYTGRLRLTLLVGAAGLFVGFFSLRCPAVFVWIFSYVIAWYYSMPPRFKESLFGGPLVASFGQLCLPATTFIVEFGFYSPLSLLWLSFLFLFGIRMILLHQLIDIDSDRITGVQTTALTLGYERTVATIRVFFSCEIVIILVFLLTLISRSTVPGWCLLCCSPCLVYVVARVYRRKKVSLISYEYIPLADLTESYLPIFLSISLMLITHWNTWWLFGFVLLVFSKRHWERIVLPWITLREEATG